MQQKCCGSGLGAFWCLVSRCSLIVFWRLSFPALLRSLLTPCLMSVCPLLGLLSCPCLPHRLSLLTSVCPPPLSLLKCSSSCLCIHLNSGGHLLACPSSHQRCTSPCFSWASPAPHTCLVGEDLQNLLDRLNTQAFF